MIRARLLFIVVLCVSSRSAAASDLAANAERVEPIGQLRSSVLLPAVRHTVRGVISRVGSPLFIQDRTGGAEVELRVPNPSLRIGDEVRVSGTLVMMRYSARLEMAQLEVLAPGVPEPAVSLTASMAASGNYDRVYVETEGVLRATRRTAESLWLLLDGVREPFVAELPLNEMAVNASMFALQSRLRVRGICIMDDRRSGEATPFALKTVTMEDVTVVSPPPFWNRTHVLELVGVLLLAGISLMAFYVRMERWRFGLILDERTRMAHDLHDTLAQSFTGVAYQLQAIRNAIRSGADNVEKQVALASAMVADSQEDARRSIAMLRPADLDTGNVLENLRQQGEALVHGAEVRFTLESSGDVERVAPELGYILLRIGHEAITNALRHARASHIAIALRVVEDLVILEVKDDGCGISQGSLRVRGFGMRAMHARAHSYGGTLEVHSNPGEGTMIRASIPLRARRTWRSRLFSILGEEMMQK